MAEDDIPKAPPLALFSLDLGANGGVLAPTSANELFQWVDHEIQAWSWLSSVGGGNYRGAIDSNIGPLRNAHGHAQQAMQYEANTPGAAAQFYGQIQASIQDTFIARAFPHSSSPLFHAVEEIRSRDPMEAVAYLYTRMHGANNYQFDARDISSWRGFLAGVLEQIPTDGIPARAYQAALESMSDTRVSAERLLAEKTEAYSALHRNYESVSADVSTIGANQEALFEGFMETNQKAQDDALAAHQGRMKTLEDTFREKMALRAPVEYWEGRQEKHEKGTKVMGGLSFGAMALLAIAIGLVASWVLHNLTPDGKPEVWRVSVLVLIGVLGVWATIVDLAGVRIALYFPAERLEVDKIIRERFTVAEVKPFEGSEKPPFKKPIFRVLGDQSFAVTRDFSN